jgi:histidyl-tRNA synthetase
MAKPKFQTPRGMHDIFSEQWRYYQKILDVVEEFANFYNFERIETPILEETELFTKGIGLTTDIVQKEMFSLRTKGGDHLSLRPEGTAPIVRAYIQHGLQNFPQPIKFWYFGPFFRYERPQSGRLRQFWQFGFEVLGEESPALDAQIILIFYNILKELKFKNLILKINSIGDSFCRPYYKKVLTSYLKSRINSLCQDCKRRLKENPLRVLDCKEETCQRIVSQAPQILDHLCENCKKHLKQTLEFLEELELPYNLDPYLVRGLDYYTKTVFEIFEDTEKGKEVGALVGGGRFNALAKILGGGEVPAVGGAGGVERIVLLIKEKAIRFPKEKKAKVFLAQIGDLAKRKALKLIEEFRKEEVPIFESLGRDSLKSQLKVADRLKVKYVLILGQKEALENRILLRDMESGKQKVLNLKKIIKEIKKIIK